jgi:hypothetical protein
VQFQKGQSGNPNGRPRGARNKRTLAAEMLLDEKAEALTDKAIELAMKGDIAALRLCIERICPPRRHATVSFELPKLESVADASAAMARIVQGLADGELTPIEVGELTRAIESFRRTMEASDFELRLRAMEKRFED